MKKAIRLLIVFLVASFFLVMLAKSERLSNADNYLSDALYQQAVAVDGNIIIIAVDEKALACYGPYQDWNREKVAETIQTLNKSKDCRPTVIGVDILYSTEGTDDTDNSLVHAAEEYGNVVTACAATFDTGFVENGNSFIYDGFQITYYEEPFEKLKAVTTTGHINAMMDSDGILRHHLLQIALPDGTMVPSMALAIALKYDEDLAIPNVNSNGFWYLPYSKEPGSFESISIVDVLYSSVPPDYFNGKIVLIGPMAAGLQDSYITSIDHAKQMYGVEYQANAIAALLDGSFKREADDNRQFIALLLILCFACILFWKGNIRCSTALWILSSSGWILLCKFMYGRGTILHVLYVPLGITILYVGSLAVHAIKESIKRRQITHTFERYVAPEIVKELLASETDSLKLGGKSCDIAVLFVDIRGFTTMSEKLSPEIVVEILNKYLTLISDCIFKYSGTLDKYVGDAVMAFWGAPLPQADYVMNAARAAMDMASEARKLSEELERQYGQGLSFGIGIHIGNAVVGNIGSPKRMDYTAIGDTVNTAARLEANAPGGTIYISGAVVNALKGRIIATPLTNPPKLKGKSNNFEILTLDTIL